MRVASAALMLTTAVLMMSCSTDSRVDKLQRQVDALDNDLKALKQEVDSLKSDSSAAELDRSFETVAYLTPGSAGYWTIKTSVGSLAVSLDDVKPYANGSRVVLRFGNLTSATLDDVSVKLDWGSVDAKGTPQNDSAKSKEVTFTQSFRPGSWNAADVVLEGVPPSSLGFVRLSNFSNKKIHLFK